MATPSPPILPNIASLTSPLIFGEIFNGYLFGVLTVQVYLYHITFPADTVLLKSLVYGLFAFEFTSTFLCLVDAYHWFATGFANIGALNIIHFSAIDTPMMGAIVAATAQTFYAYRIHRINRKAWPVCIVVILIACAEVVAGIYGGVVGTISGTFSGASSAQSLPAIYVIFIGAAIADIIIATTMIFLLACFHIPNNRQSSLILTRILNLTVETNLLSTSLAVLTVILLVAVPGTNYFVAPAFVLGKVYSNSLLLILNNRHYLAMRIEQTSHPSPNSTNSGSSTTGSLTRIQAVFEKSVARDSYITIDITRAAAEAHRQGETVSMGYTV